MTARRLRLVDVAMPQPSLQMSEVLLDWRLQRRLVHCIHWYAGRRKLLRPVLRCETANARQMSERMNLSTICIQFVDSVYTNNTICLVLV
jgi:hypothetical protein